MLPPRSRRPPVVFARRPRNIGAGPAVSYADGNVPQGRAQRPQNNSSGRTRRAPDSRTPPSRGCGASGRALGPPWAPGLMSSCRRSGVVAGSLDLERPGELVVRQQGPPRSRRALLYPVAASSAAHGRGWARQKVKPQLGGHESGMERIDRLERQLSWRPQRPHTTRGG
jgi:hypothetical protein